MACPKNKIDSNSTGLRIAEEECLKQLPGTDGDAAVWYEQEPNSYSDLGADTSSVAKDTINPSRQIQKGTITDIDAMAGWNIDFAPSKDNNRIMQGFLFADAREKVSTAPINGTAVAITAVDDVTDAYQAASGLDAFKANDLVFVHNFDDVENNGLALVVSASATDLVVDKALVADASPASTAFIEQCGYEFPTGDLNVTVNPTNVELTSTATDFTTLGLTVGETIIIGGDAAVNKFVNSDQVYARISKIEANTLTLDDTTKTMTTETGTGLEIQIFFGTVQRNEKDPSLIKRRSWHVERTLGEDADGPQAEYVEGAVPNELTYNISTADKMTTDLTFVGLDNSHRTGAEGLKSDVGTKVPAEDNPLFNTSSDIYRIKLSILDGTLNPSGTFAYVSNTTVNVSNGVTADKAVGVIGGFDTSTGNFTATASIDNYFTVVESIKAVRNNDDASLNIIVAKDNVAHVIDFPYGWLEDGKLNVEKDTAITQPLVFNAAENTAGYTMLTTTFPYAPNGVMG